MYFMLTSTNSFTVQTRFCFEKLKKRLKKRPPSHDWRVAFSQGFQTILRAYLITSRCSSPGLISPDNESPLWWGLFRCPQSFLRRQTTSSGQWLHTQPNTVDARTQVRSFRFADFAGWNGDPSYSIV